jgi:MFS family permease
MLNKIFQLTKYSHFDAPTLHHNIRLHIMDGLLFGFAMSFVSVSTIMPVFIQQVGGNAVAIGSVPVLWTIGVNLPQAVFVRFSHTGGQSMPAMLRYGALHRFFFLAIAIFTFIAAGRLSAALMTGSLLILIFLAAMAGSLAQPPWFQVFTKTTPVKIRGRLIALRQTLSSGLGILGGSIVTLILATVAVPYNFGILFVIAFAFAMASYAYLRHLREPGAIKEEPVQHKGVVLHVRTMLASNRAIRDFVIVDALTLMSMTAAAFYAVYAIEKFHLSASYAGTFTALVMCSMVLGNIAFGFIGDHFGHHLNLMILAACSAAASLIALIAGNILIYGFVFFFMACTMSLQGISRLSFVAELCSEADRPIFIALVNTITAPSVIVGIVAGALARWFGFSIVFGLSAVLALAALAWLYKYVPEPRRLEHGYAKL